MADEASGQGASPAGSPASSAQGVTPAAAPTSTPAPVAPVAPAPAAPATPAAPAKPDKPADKPADKKGGDLRNALKEPAEPAKPESAAPEKYEAFVFPEGHTMDPEILGKFSEKAKALGLSQKQAQAMVDLDVERHALDEAAVVRQLDQWNAEMEAMSGFKEMRGHAAKASRALQADPDLAGFDKLMDHPIMGHPVMFRIFAKFGKLLADDRILSGAPPQGTGGRDYPSMAP